MTARKVYTVCCPGSGRYDEAQRKTMSKDDRRLHPGGGWYSLEYPIPCPKCGDQVQPRGVHWEVDL